MRQRHSTRAAGAGRGPARSDRRRVVSGAAIVGLMLMAPGCSPHNAAPHNAAPASAHQESSAQGDASADNLAAPGERMDPMAAAQAGAAESGADPEQIAVLADGVVTYDEYEQSLTRAFACMREAGATVSVQQPKQQNGATVIAYQVGANGNAVERAADACYRLHAEFVEGYWQIGSPDVIAFEERRTAALLPALRDCLDQHGVDWVEDEAFVELSSKSGTIPSDPVQFNCMSDIGYWNWSGDSNGLAAVVATW